MPNIEIINQAIDKLSIPNELDNHNFTKLSMNLSKRNRYIEVGESNTTNEQWFGQIKYMKALKLIQNTNLAIFSNSFLNDFKNGVYKLMMPTKCQIDSHGQCLKINGIICFCQIMNDLELNIIECIWDRYYLYDIYLNKTIPSKQHYELIIKLADLLMNHDIKELSQKHLDMNYLTPMEYFNKYPNEEFYLYEYEHTKFNTKLINLHISNQITESGPYLIKFDHDHMSFKDPSIFDHKIEGYWGNLYNPNYPQLIINTEKWTGQNKYMKYLNFIQQNLCEYICYNSLPTSHINHHQLLSDGAYRIEWGDYTYEWPADFLYHYVYQYNVKPSKEHYNLIIEIYDKNQ